MSKQITAVEWLVQQLPIRIINSYQSEIAKAKQMEKEQIMDAWNIGLCIQDTNDVCAEYYYNETFNETT